VEKKEGGLYPGELSRGAAVGDRWRAV